MCGIVGQFVRSQNIDLNILCDATNTLEHRGPDEGTWWSDGPFFLGHRRLSIIDISHGTQPMASVNGRYVVAFNGEIYNYVELRKELLSMGFSFQTHSDTEVLLVGYEAWGTELPTRLIGMFALALVDRLKKTLFLCRDRFGEKPLFICEQGETISFASEVKALTLLPQENRSLDLEALAGYLCLNYVPDQNTLIKNIKKFPPATWRLYSNEGIQEEKYWSFKKTLSAHHSMEETISALSGQIDQAVNIALRSDVPIALFLSGGIDSSIIAESATRQGNLKHAYCLDFEESNYSEWSNASFVAKKLGIELRRVSLSSKSLNNFFELTEHADDPLGDSSSLAVWTLSQAVAKDYKVVITGDGADELFGGYLTYKATAYHSLIMSKLPFALRKKLSQLSSTFSVTDGKVSTSYKLARFLRAADMPSAEAHFTWNGTWLPSQTIQLVTGEAKEWAKLALKSLVTRHRISNPPTLLQLQNADISDYLVNDILVKVDRMTMAHGLESRTPFLMPALAEFALNLPDPYKVTAFGKTKMILRNLALKLYGTKIATAKKQGFSIPVHQWLRNDGRMIAEDLLTYQNLEDFGVLNSQAILNEKMQHMQGKKQIGYELWGLMTLIAWHKTRFLNKTTRDRVSSNLKRIVIPEKF